jgi:hypothetical protein
MTYTTGQSISMFLRNCTVHVHSAPGDERIKITSDGSAGVPSPIADSAFGFCAGAAERAQQFAGKSFSAAFSGDAESALENKPRWKIDHVGAGCSLVIDTLEQLTWTHTVASERLNYAAAEAAIAKLNADQHGGHTDWRLPTVQELSGLVDYSRHEPAIDTALFPDTKPSAYWTSTPAAWAPAEAVWIVYFGNGYSDDYRRGSTAFVRAVRSSRQ